MEFYIVKNNTFMSKPLGYYTPHIPGDKSLLDELEQQYGSQFEILNVFDKLYLISFLATNMSSQLFSASTAPSNDARLTASRIFGSSIDPSTKLGLIKFLADNVSLGKYPVNPALPDPAWDYYETWQILHRMKGIAEDGIKLISTKETADSETDAKLNQLIEPFLSELEGTVDDLNADTIPHN